MCVCVCVCVCVWRERVERGRGMQELYVDGDRQPTKTESRGLPEGGPTPLHRDTTIPMRRNSRIV